MLYTAKDIQEALRINYNEYRSRFEAIRSILETKEWVRMAAGNARIFDDAGFKLIERMHELHKAGHTLEEAANIIGEELGERPFADGNWATERDIRLLRKQIGDIQKQLGAIDTKLGRLTAPWWQRVLPLFRVGNKEETRHAENANP